MRTIHGTTWSVEDARAYIKARVEEDANGCWIWQRAKRSGYGGAKVPRRRALGAQQNIQAHRLAYEAFVGPIAKGHGHHGMVVMHSCDTPLCCNPSHLFLGVHSDNMADMRQKGRARGFPGEANARSKLNDTAVLEIRSEYATGAVSQKALATKHGVSRGRVSEIVSGSAWAHILNK